MSNSEVYRDPNAPIEARVEDLLGRMTLEEKVEQMHGAGFPADSRGLYPTPENARLGIPGFAMVDGPRGVSAATGFATTFPVGSARGATFDPDLERRVGRAIGEEARARAGERAARADDQSAAPARSGAAPRRPTARTRTTSG